jgi:hypothetical protein
VVAAVYKIPMLAPGAGGPWIIYASGPELQGDPSACGGSGNDIAIGANGIIHDGQYFYVSNTDRGLIVKIPRVPDGGVDAGDLIVLAQDCELAGADGLAFATNGDLLVANAYKSKIQRVSKNTGAITTVAEGPPLEGPSSLWPDGKRLLISNLGYASLPKYYAALADAGGDAAFEPSSAHNPALLSIPLP